MPGGTVCIAEQVASATLSQVAILIVLFVTITVMMTVMMAVKVMMVVMMMVLTVVPHKPMAVYINRGVVATAGGLKRKSKRKKKLTNERAHQTLIK